ncbi:hypothetical protein Dsin_022834 [Dipteronia sinensis]|uniref:RRM domain-containing protein n=1 Tax=Dipteronia sinensis TaxID=43782 RepID=A0AAE0E0F8_9ROSI|nr:hypothetical protein Dsin_022834 [Dipteronia sinensis]
MAALRSVAAPRSLRRFFSTTNVPAFNPLSTAPASEAAQQHPKAEPSTNLHVTGLSKRTTTEKLREKASEFGEVINARVVTDRVTGYSRCFGFVKYATLEDAAKGIAGMDGQSMQDLDYHDHRHLRTCLLHMATRSLHMAVSNLHIQAHKLAVLRNFS